MLIETSPSPVSKKTFWIGWILSVLPALMLIFSAGMKFAEPAGMQAGLDHLGWSMDLATGLGILEISCAVIYLIPQVAILGAILVTGYLGGAIATHVRVGDPFFAQAILGVVFWAGIYLREPRLRALIPFVPEGLILTAPHFASPVCSSGNWSPR